ncbi:uncharacterized protein ASCRUDRAFT_73972 [Ascoidea rubescens DSM 1968]|uniref:Uncharacterized protein n=1 Tax=Ascoidea rubescens DSM 1968 TaxID=1344418 RepID=A0A1D2VRV9_9ASCO|nr:hypothetical protein ASCRUDRAFT_73972 [Ascoidea rubescens DSM 1968]ODV64330.1 hypothetical protein ASCRUDRAFT_73972 [Ascoidea rubescens DSM 1968]
MAGAEAETEIASKQDHRKIRNCKRIRGRGTLMNLDIYTKNRLKRKKSDLHLTTENKVTSKK